MKEKRQKFKDMDAGDQIERMLDILAVALGLIWLWSGIIIGIDYLETCVWNTSLYCDI